MTISNYLFQSVEILKYYWVCRIVDILLKYIIRKILNRKVFWIITFGIKTAFLVFAIFKMFFLKKLLGKSKNEIPSMKNCLFVNGYEYRID